MLVQEDHAQSQQINSLYVNAGQHHLGPQPIPSVHPILVLQQTCCLRYFIMYIVPAPLQSTLQPNMLLTILHIQSWYY